MAEQTQEIVKAPRKEVNAFTQLPETHEAALKYCEYLASSQIVPKQYQGHPQDIFVAVSWGQEIGMKPMQSLKSIGVINGTPGLYGPGYIGLINAHPDCEFLLFGPQAYAYVLNNVDGFEELGEINKSEIEICVSKRKSRPFPAVAYFSLEDVQKAGLAGRETYKKWSERMMKYRAFHDMAKDYWSDVTHGIEMFELLKEDHKNQDEPDEFKDGLKQDQADPLSEELADGLKDPEAVTDKTQDVSDAEVLEETEENEEANPEPAAKKETDPKWVHNRTVQDIIKSAKYLDKKKSNQLAQLISKQNGKLSVSQAEEWKDMIRVAHEKHKKNKS